MLPKTKQLEVENICYAHISNLFAFFSNPVNCGPNFTWDRFVEMCERQADFWVWDVKGDPEKIRNAARTFAVEKAKGLVYHVNNGPIA